MPSKMTENDSGPSASPVQLSDAQQELLKKWLGGAGEGSAGKSDTIPRRTTPDWAPLSFDQQRLWFLEQLRPGTPLYNIAFAFRFCGPMNLSALERSLAEIIRRHEILRTTFHSRDGQPIQRIAPPGPFALNLTDLEALPETTRPAEARRQAVEEAGRPFDLECGPLFRASLLRLNASEHRLLLTAHHLVFDAWSENLFVHELSALYNSFCDGQPCPLPELPIQYGDFASWQQQNTPDEAFQKQLAFWKRCLGGELPRLNLPVDRPRSAATEAGGAAEKLDLDAALARELKVLSRSAGATLFMTLLAAWKVLLHRYSGQDDIIVGSPVAGRSWSEVEPLIGFFVNTLVLWSDLSGVPSFRQLLEQVRQTVLNAHANQDLPFERLVQELGAERAAGLNPLFDVMFVFQVSSAPDWRMSQLSVDARHEHTGTAKFDLTLFTTDMAGEVTLLLEYNTCLFNADTARRMLRHYRRLLESIVANPNARLDELEILEPAERRQLLVEWNETRADYPQDQCVHQLYEAQARRAPDEVAAMLGNKRLSYRELDARANQLACHLRTLGVAPDVRVGICVERSLEMLVGVLAILKAGGAYVPLDPNYPAERLACMVSDSKAPVLLTQRRLVELLPPTDARLVCLDEPLPAQTPLSGSAFRLLLRGRITWPTSSTPPVRRANPRAWPWGIVPWSTTPKANHGEGFGGFGGKGVEVENKDSCRCIGHDERDRASARRDLFEHRMQSRGDRIEGAQVGLGDAGNERAFRQRREGIHRSRRPAGNGGGKSAFWREFHRRMRPGNRGCRGLEAEFVEEGCHYRDASMKVTLLISFNVVRPRRTRSSADSRRKLMPSFCASLRTSDVGFFSRISSRIGSVRSSNS